jgi:hypothetical protein
VEPVGGEKTRDGGSEKLGPRIGEKEQYHVIRLLQRNNTSNFKRNFSVARAKHTAHTVAQEEIQEKKERNVEEKRRKRKWIKDTKQEKQRTGDEGE